MEESNPRVICIQLTYKSICVHSFLYFSLRERAL